MFWADRKEEAEFKAATPGISTRARATNRRKTQDRLELAWPVHGPRAVIPLIYQEKLALCWHRHAICDVRGRRAFGGG